MTWPLAESLRATVPGLPRALFTSRAVERLVSIADAARGSMDAFGFECRLGRSAERVDLGLRLAKLEGAERWVGSVGRSRGLRPPVSSVFLEYDAENSLPSPVPSIFLVLDVDGNAAAKRTVRPAAVKRLLLSLMEPDRLARRENALTLCFARLPRKARVRVVGIMRGRSPLVGRLSVSLPARDAGDYLRDIGWPYWSREVALVVNRLAPRAESLTIDFDVGAKIGPKVGVHFSSASARSRVLDTLVALGLCTPAKARAVLAWPRVMKVRLSKHGWPYRFERYLNHLKVTCAGGTACEAKAYLGVEPGFALLGWTTD
jgi:hypothetical protein